jgi:hypothetical protein
MDLAERIVSGAPEAAIVHVVELPARGMGDRRDTRHGIVRIRDVLPCVGGVHGIRPIIRDPVRTDGDRPDFNAGEFIHELCGRYVPGEGALAALLLLTFGADRIV